MVDASGALFSAFLQVLLDRIASRKLLEFFNSHNMEKDLIETLETRLLSVNAVLGDAEEKQITDPLVKSWVDKLRETLYDAEDVLDLIATKALQCNQDYRVIDKVIVYLSSLISPGSELKRIDDKLKSIVEHRYLLGLKEGGEKISSLFMPTTCLIDEGGLYRRIGDKESIVNQLLSFSQSSGVPVIAIVGMAGIGKTALSQMVFNDFRVESHFHVRSWVYISDGSNVFEVTKKIYDSLTCSNSVIRDLSTLQMELSHKLSGKRFLLVLDDFWAEDFLDWDLLKRPFGRGAVGSSIIVTSRNTSAALTMHATAPYHLMQCLPYEDSLELFTHYAFRTRDPEEFPVLMGIGEQIVGKYKGHPLYVKTLGNLLAFKTETKDWNNILQSKVWDLPTDRSNIMPALKLSYQRLPGHLKRCFAYCSLLLKGSRSSKRNWIHLWMAEGLLRLSNNEETIEEVGEEYFHELSSRSFLQDNDSFFTMHDLMIEFAQYIGGEFFHKLENNNPPQVLEKVRHLSFSMDDVDGLENFESFFNLSQLRTFLPFSNSRQPRPIGGFLSLLLSKNYLKLRVLSLSNYSIDHLPGSIGSLEHLRYLNLSRTKLSLLPDWVVSLYNLQTLILSNCFNLTALPTNLHKLTNLHHLDLTGTPLSKMPPHISRLKHLQLLTIFVVSREESNIRELGAHSKLQSTLSIVNLQEVIDHTDAARAKLKEKKFLNELELKWAADGIKDIHREKLVLDNLEPHINLKSLKIENYGGTVFSDWLGNPFSNMVSMHLANCQTCLSLPPLGQLPYLQTLDIENMTSLEVVNPEFYGNHIRPFSSLKKLIFKNMSIWEGWRPGEETEFPSLQVFHIETCPNLGGLLPSVPALQTLKLVDCSALASLPEEMNQASLIISACPLLVPLCERDVGLYWDLVSGLRGLVIDGARII